MTREEAIEVIKLAMAQVEWDYPMDYAAAFDMAIKALEQEPTTKNDSRVDYTINSLDNFIEFGKKAFGVELTIKAIEQEPILDKIRKQIKSNLRGVEIALEVLVENDPLRPKMEGAKDTLEDCLDIIDKYKAENNS